MKYVQVEDIPTKAAQQTGIYIGPAGDHRYYKAGDRVATTYKFDRDFDPRGYRAPIVVAKPQAATK